MIKTKNFKSKTGKNPQKILNQKKFLLTTSSFINSSTSLIIKNNRFSRNKSNKKLKKNKLTFHLPLNFS